MEKKEYALRIKLVFVVVHPQIISDLLVLSLFKADEVDNILDFEIVIL